MSEPVVTKRCELCCTPLEYTAGDARFTFTKHDSEFCRVGTLQRIDDLNRLLLGQREQFEHAAQQIRRRWWTLTRAQLEELLSVIDSLTEDA